MIIVEKIIGNIKDFQLKGKNIDLIKLSHDDMLKTHQKCHTINGKEIGISLKYAETLKIGDIVYEDPDLIISIDAEEEYVFIILPKNNLELARICFNIGNMHKSLYINEDTYIVPYDSVIEKLLNTMKVSYKIEKTKVIGEKAAIKVFSTHSHENTNIANKE